MRSNSPVVQGNIKAAITPLQQQLTESTLPAIRDSAESSGNFGSSRQGIAEGLAAGRESQAEGSATANIINNAYNTNVDAQLKALGLLPQTQGAQTTGSLTQSDVGDVQQSMNQALLGEQVGNYNYDQMAPYLQGKDIMSLLTGMPGGTTVSTGTTPTANPVTGALGGAAAGASLGSLLGPAGAAGGAGIGALLSFLH